MNIIQRIANWFKIKRQEDPVHLKIVEFGKHCRAHPTSMFRDYQDQIAELYIAEDATWEDLTSQQKAEALAYFREGLTAT